MMIKVTLLGDSIRAIGYGKVVPQLLGDGFEVFQPSENCRYAKHTLRGLFDWGQQMKGTHIVHWNNGLWDLCHLFGDGPFSGEEEYLSTMLRIAGILTKRYDKVIFATTTPVRSENVYNNNSDIEHYNQILVPKLREMGVMINDLHAAVAADVYRYIGEDTIHLTEDGIRLCAHQVADIIKEAAKTLAVATEDENTEPSIADASLGLPI